jgi:hypothetical protein
MAVHEGVVGKGNGLAKGWINEDPQLWEALDPKLCLGGTLNIYVSGSYPSFEQDFHASSLRAAGCLRTVPCKINGHAAFILRIECPGPRTPIPQPNTMLEIIALKLDLTAGSAVCIEFDPSLVTNHAVPLANG